MLLLLLSFPLLLLPHCQCLHHRLTKRELQHVFGVEEKHQVPEYHLIRPERVRTDDGRLRLRFGAWDETYEMELRPKSLLSPHLVSVVRNGTQAQEYKGLSELHHECHYQGKVKSHSDAPVALSDCRSLMGTLHLSDHFLVLQTIPRRVRHLQEEDHLVFKRAASLLTSLEGTIEEEVARLNEYQEPFCDTSESMDDPNTAQILHLNYSIPSAARLDSPVIFPNMDPITLEIGLFLDSKLYEHFQREYIQEAEQHLLDFSLALINNVHVLYQQPTLSPNLDIVIVRYEMWKAQPSNLETYVHKGGQAQSLLDAFCRHQAHVNPGTDLTDPGHWDHGVLLTGYDIYHTTASVAGVAPVARMCDPLFACSLVEGLHLGRSFVLAHEMGHNMGMVHDGVQNQCNRSRYLMSAVNGAGKTTWSDCSVREFNAFLFQLDESGRGNCLRDGSEGLTAFNHLTDGRLPGQRFTADQQCSYFWGREYRVEIPAGKGMDDICRILWCGNSGSTISTAHPALEGSWCGDGRWCHEGHCSPWPNFPPPDIIHGSWSEWSSGEKLCPVQNCNVLGSITIKAQHRDCVNPAPNNGGRLCEGSSIRGVICGFHVSHCHSGLSRQEFSNRVCSSIKYDPNRPDRNLTGEGFDHSTQPCRVWCHLTDSELIRNKGQFPDGSPCGDGQFCVGGSCLPVSCGNKAVVSADEDCPVSDTELSRWAEWSPWSECSVSCGSGGIQQRKRSCFDPLGLNKCHGASEDRRECQPAPKACESQWGEWSSCDAVCGEGIQRRTRTCLTADCHREEKKMCRAEGCWSAWENWGSCSVQCGGGHQRRNRACPSGDCRGQSFEFQACNDQSCLEDSWGDWLPCSVSCGIGFQIRERLCGGKLCASSNKQARTCNEQACPTGSDSTNSAWNDWSEWTECSQNCGEGVQTRERTCKEGPCPRSEALGQRRCVSRACSTWNDWSDWSICTSCSSVETRNRNRKCSSSFFFDPVGDCIGEAVETQGCDAWCNEEESLSNHNAIELLTSKGRKKVVAHGGRIIPFGVQWGSWTEWTKCTVSCGGGSRRRSRVCVGEGCPPQPLEVKREVCNEQDCEDGFFWGSWSDWSECNLSCGEGGVQTRRRKCRGFFAFQCSGSSAMTRECSDLPDCPSQTAVRPMVPQWSTWSPWSSCSCFTSTETRRRYCRISDPALQGFCSGSILQQRPCKPASCVATSGGWSTWSEWSSCSKDCQGSGGHQIRNRMCSEPLPANRGAYCTGYSFDQRACSSNEVCSSPIDGGWSEWTSWSECSDPCNNGHKSRTRFCSNPRPSHGGQQCYGSDFELQPCSDPSRCNSIDGSWSSWSTWSECPASCGFALQTRDRVCAAPVPQDGGQECAGIAVQSTVCSTEPCDETYDGEWSNWQPWSECLGNCGVSSRIRTRECSAPSGNGAPCFGRSFESEDCSPADASFCSRFVHHSSTLDTLYQIA